MKDWIKDLKVGDKVIISGRWEREVCTVEHATACFVTVQGSKFNRKTGRLSGEANGWGHRYLNEATPEAISEICGAKKLRELRHFVKTLRADSLTVEQLEQIKAIVKGATA